MPLVTQMVYWYRLALPSPCVEWAPMRPGGAPPTRVQAGEAHPLCLHPWGTERHRSAPATSAGWPNTHTPSPPRTQVSNRHFCWLAEHPPRPAPLGPSGIELWVDKEGASGGSGADGSWPPPRWEPPSGEQMR